MGTLLWRWNLAFALAAGKVPTVNVPLEKLNAAIALGAKTQSGDEAGGKRLLEHRAAEVDRRRQVEQEPRGQVAVLVILAHIRLLQPRGDVPVDVAHVVAVLVLADIRQVEPVATEERALVLTRIVYTNNHHASSPT